MSKESKPNSQQPGGDAGAGAAAEASVTAEDLDLISASLEDEAKTDEQIFDEIGVEEAAAANPDAEPAASLEDELITGLDAGKKPDDAAGTAKPSGEDDEEGKQEPGEADKDAADKLWAGASDEQRAAFDATQAIITKLEHSDRSQKGRVSTLQRQLTDVTRQLDQGANKAIPGQPGDTDGTATTAFLASKDWKDFQGEYPEVAAPLGKLVAGLQAELTGQKKQMDAISTDRRHDTVEEQTELLEKEHSDWLDAVTDDAFGPWLEDQPRHMREAAVRNAKEIVDASEAADVVGRFKAFRSEQSDDSAGPGDDGDKGKKPKPDDQELLTSLSDKRTLQLEASAGARPSGASAAHGIPEDGDDEAIWKAFDAKEAREAAAAR